MAGLKARVSGAFRALFADSPGAKELIPSIVLPREVHDYSQRARQWDARELVRFYAKHAYVAANNNASAVASTPVKLYRRGRAGKVGKSAWRCKALKRWETTRLGATAGSIARKALSMDDGVEEITDQDHPLLALLRRPNPKDRGYELLEDTVLGLDLTGDHYWDMVPPSVVVAGFPVVELWPLEAQFTRPVPDREKFIKEYIYGRGTEVERKLPPERVIPFHYANPTGDPYHGTSCLEACIYEQRLSLAFAQFALQVINNGMQPGVVVSPKDAASGMSESQRKQLEADLNNKSGAYHAGKNIVLNFPAEIRPLTYGEKEMPFFGSEDVVMKTIARCFGNPIEFFTMESAALATAAVARQKHQIDAVLPRCKRIEDALNQDLVSLYLSDEEGARGEELFLCFEPPVTEDATAISTRTQGEYREGLITKNEGRIAIGRDADPTEDGDKYKEPDPVAGLGSDPGAKDTPPAKKRTDCGCGKRVPGDQQSSCVDQLTGALMMAGIPEKEARKEAKERCRKGTGGAGGSPGGGSSPRTPGYTGPLGVNAPSGNVQASMRADLLAQKAAGCCHTPPRIVTKDDKWRGIAPHERDLEAAVRGFFNGVTPDVVGSVSSNGIGLDLSADPLIQDQFLNGTRDILQRLWTMGWNQGVGELGGRHGNAHPLVNFSAEASEYLRTFQGKLIGSVLPTVDAAIRSQLAEGIDAGEGVVDLKARVASVMEGASSWGAERIARTEAARAYLTSRQQAWIDSGEVTRKKWLLSADPCEVCQEIAESHNEAAIDQPFVNKGTTIAGMLMDYSDLDVPPAHPGCRCSVGAVFRED